MAISFHEVSLTEPDAYKRGCHYGAELKDEIHRHIVTWTNLFTEELHVTTDELFAEAHKIWPFIVEYSTEISREIEGIAYASDSKLEEIVALNAINELYINRRTEPFGCTSFGVTGRATVDGKTYVGQTDDLMPWEAEFGVVFRIQTSEAHIVGFSFAGALPIIGMNANGISLCINALYDGKSRPGVPVAVITADILRQKTIGQALYSIARAQRATSVNLLIGDRHGELYSVEMTQDRYVALYGQDSLVHTNHFLSRDLLTHDLRERDLALRGGTSTIVRYNRMRKLLDRNYGNIDKSKLKEFISDHVNYPESICRHSVDSRSAQTIAAFIMDPAEGKVLVADGNPCQARYYEYSIEEQINSK